MKRKLLSYVNKCSLCSIFSSLNVRKCEDCSLFVCFSCKQSHYCTTISINKIQYGKFSTDGLRTEDKNIPKLIYQSNQQINKNASMMKKIQICSRCQQDKPTIMCRTCGMKSYCEGCFSLMHKTLKMKNHILMSEDVNEKKEGNMILNRILSTQSLNDSFNQINADQIKQKKKQEKNDQNLNNISICKSQLDSVLMRLQTDQKTIINKIKNNRDSYLGLLNNLIDQVNYKIMVIEGEVQQNIEKQVEKYQQLKLKVKQSIKAMQLLQNQCINNYNEYQNKIKNTIAAQTENIKVILKNSKSSQIQQKYQQISKQFISLVLSLKMRIFDIDMQKILAPPTHLRIPLQKDNIKNKNEYTKSLKSSMNQSYNKSNKNLLSSSQISKDKVLSVSMSQAQMHKNANNSQFQQSKTYDTVVPKTNPQKYLEQIPVNVKSILQKIIHPNQCNQSNIQKNKLNKSYLNLNKAKKTVKQLKNALNSYRENNKQQFHMKKKSFDDMNVSQSLRNSNISIQFRCK